MGFCFILFFFSNYSGHVYNMSFHKTKETLILNELRGQRNVVCSSMQNANGGRTFRRGIKSNTKSWSIINEMVLSPIITQNDGSPPLIIHLWMMMIDGI